MTLVREGSVMWVLTPVQTAMFLSVIVVAVALLA